MLRSLLRITAVIATLIAIAVALIRQPTLTGFDFGSRPRADPAALRR